MGFDGHARGQEDVGQVGELVGLDEDEGAVVLLAGLLVGGENLYAK